MGETCSMHTGTRNEYMKLTGQSKVNVGFEALIAVVMKSTVFWDIMRYSPLKVKRRFRVT
jgi:hypothetical protein